MIRTLMAATALATLASPAFAETIPVAPGEGAQERLQEALILAEPGDEIFLQAGRFVLTDGLSLDVDGVTVRDRGEISRSSSGNITLLEVYGSSLDTPVARVEFDGLQCDRTRQEWLDLTREVLMLACDSEVPCERVN